MLSAKTIAALAELGEVNALLADLIETLADEECVLCKTFPFQCHIWNNDGTNLKHVHPEIFCDSAKKCKTFQEKTASVLPPAPA